ncbi:methionine ABC transporter permease [Clostridium sp. Marseille-P299]|uniref:methionine ABC transporter permease n=1 Tax=Clostridium sp. Marseille-P299 TaxID=1805477 RepID=UPI0008338447|nr:methionine ABC transporter permease [Clostridium sp. Marseille-P299]
MFDSATIQMLVKGLGESLYMIFFSTFLSYVIGLPLGVILVVTDKQGIRPMPIINKVLGFIVNILRSVPFIILLLAISPFTRMIVGTTLGTNATIVALVVSASPYIARLVESSIKEVDAGVIEAAQSMGSTPFQIVCKVLVPEAKPSLIVGAAIAITTILGYTAMAGFVGGGGLGDIAIRYGYQRYQTDIMMVTVVILVILVQIFQEFGIRLAKTGDKRINK